MTGVGAPRAEDGARHTIPATLKRFNTEESHPMFHITVEAVSRRVHVIADIKGEELPADIPVRYHQNTIIRPDRVKVTAFYGQDFEKTEPARWRIDSYGGIEVFGHAVLKSNNTGRNRHSTYPTEAQAPWAYQWAQRILATLNSMPVPEIAGTLTLNLPDLDATSVQP